MIHALIDHLGLTWLGMLAIFRQHVAPTTKCQHLWLTSHCRGNIKTILTQYFFVGDCQHLLFLLPLPSTMPHPCPHPCSLASLALALTPLSALARVALAPCRHRWWQPIEVWLLCSLPAQQHIDHITKLKTFPVSSSWTCFDSIRKSMCLVWVRNSLAFFCFDLRCCETMKNLRGKKKVVNIPIFIVFVYDYIIYTDSYVHAGVCVGDRSHWHYADNKKNGQQNRMSPTCWDDICNMSATYKTVCCLRGGADRHKSWYCQPMSIACPPL